MSTRNSVVELNTNRLKTNTRVSTVLLCSQTCNRLTLTNIESFERLDVFDDANFNNKATTTTTTIIIIIIIINSLQMQRNKPITGDWTDTMNSRRPNAGTTTSDILVDSL